MTAKMPTFSLKSVLFAILCLSIWNAGTSQIRHSSRISNLFSNNSPGPFDTCTRTTFQNIYEDSVLSGVKPTIFDLIVTSTNHVVAAGIYKDEAFAIEYDPSGNIKWSFRYGQTSYGVIRKIKETADGGFIAVGQTNKPSPSTNQ